MEQYAGATEYIANALTFTRGAVGDITGVFVYHSIDPNASPVEADFTQVTLVSDPTNDPLGEDNNIDVLALVGPGVGSHVTLTPGDYQRFVAVKTTNEFIIRKIDTLTIL